MIKKLILIALIIITIWVIIDNLIEREISDTMNIILKNEDFEIIDSLRIDEKNIAYIYENSQIINGGNSRFIVIGESISCNLKDKEILLQSSSIKAFQKIKNDTLFVLSSMPFKEKVFDNKYTFSFVDVSSNKMSFFLKSKNLHNVLIKCK